VANPILVNGTADRVCDGGMVTDLGRRTKS